MNLVIYTIAVFGFAYIVGHSKISLPFREALARSPLKFLLMLLECCACFGTWLGLLYGWRFGFPLFAAPGLVAGIYLALFTCGTNLLLAKFAGLTGETDV